MIINLIWVDQVPLYRGSGSQWLLATESQIQSQVIPCEICGGQSNGTGFRKENPTRCKNVPNFYYFIFIWTFHVWKTKGCQCSFRLLMMGSVSPETCWASCKYGIIKILICCCILLDFLYESYYDAWIHEHQGTGFLTVLWFPPHLNHSTNAADSAIHPSLILYILAIDSAIQWHVDLCGGCDLCIFSLWNFVSCFRSRT